MSRTQRLQPSPKNKMLTMRAAMRDQADNPLVPIGDDQIKQALPGITIVSYPELVRGLPWDAEGRFIVLYVSESTPALQSGHWCACFKRNGFITWHDSYGLKPDEPLDWLSLKERAALGQTRKVLTELLAREGLPVVYSPYKLQSSQHKIATCGKHAVIRLLRMDLSVDAYARWLSSVNPNTDLAVEFLWDVHREAKAHPAR